MRVVNLYGPPGCGKSTLAAALLVALKERGIKAELTGEVAKDFIFQGRSLKNQYLLSAMQYDRLFTLQESGCEIAICDSPLLQQLVYLDDTHPYRRMLRHVATICHCTFDNYEVLVSRTAKYVEFGRNQTEQESNNLVNDIVLLGVDFDLQVTGDNNGRAELKEEFLKTL